MILILYMKAKLALSVIRVHMQHMLKDIWMVLQLRIGNSHIIDWRDAIYVWNVSKHSGRCRNN